MLEHEADIKLAHIPYTGFHNYLCGNCGDIKGPMVPGIAMPQVKADKVRALAVTSLEESELSRACLL